MTAHGHTPAVRHRRLGDLLRPVERFLANEAASGVVLIAAAVAAFAWANSPWAGAYERLLHLPAGLRAGPVGLELSLAHWVNDGLMAVFFFVVGLEIKRELLAGELRRARAGRAADRGGAGRHGGAGRDLRGAQPRLGRDQGLGRADGDRHRVRGRRAGPARARGSRRRSRCSCWRWRSSTTSARSS